MSAQRFSRFLMSALLFCSAVAHADTLDDIKSRGKMIVAIDPTFAPYEYTDASNAIVGYHPAVAINGSEATPRVTNARRTRRKGWPSRNG